MPFRFILALGLGLPLGQAAVANHLLRVDAGQHDRSGTPVSFTLPDGDQAYWQLTGPSGNALAILTDGLGAASFVTGAFGFAAAGVVVNAIASPSAYAPGDSTP